jgi:hypothetical protein
MKTIAFKDRTGGPIREYISPKQNDIFERENHTTRINRALDELKHTGNINIYLVRGNKIRLILQKGF